MHLCYVDEAGSTGKNLGDEQQPVFVMAGLLVSDERWRKTESEIRRITEAAFQGDLPSDFELHACELLSPEGEGLFAGWELSSPFSPRARKVLELALREAVHLRHRQIGAEHLLLGLIREGNGLAALVLTEAGLDLAELRRRTISSLDQAA